MARSRKVLILALFLIGISSALTPTAHACQTASTPFPEYLVVDADVIVRARADAYRVAPSKPNQPEWEEGELRTKIEFTVLEVLKGTPPSPLILSGILTEKDDFNDRPPPYDFVRPGGRRGNCWAYEYRKGAEYLIFLKHLNGRYTVNWLALGATNEQLRGSTDPWLLWVKGFLAGSHFIASPPKES